MRIGLKIGFGIPVLICGCIMNESKKDGDGFCPDERIISRFDLEYDRQSRITKFSIWFAASEFRFSTEYSYNEDGTVDVESYDGDSLTSRECHVYGEDSTANSRYVALCPPDSKVLGVYKYDSMERVIETWTTVGAEDSLLTKEVEYEYDDAMRLFKSYSIENGVKMLFSVTYNDENGKTLKVDRYDESGEVRETELFEYFDAHIDTRVFEGSANTQKSRAYLNENGLVTSTISCEL